MNEIVICLIITFAVVYIIDWTGAPRNMLARILSIIRGKEVTPDRVKLPYIAQCSLCATNWLCLIVLLIMNWKMTPMAFIFSYMTKPVLYLFNVIDLLIDKIYKIVYAKISSL